MNSAFAHRHERLRQMKTGFTRGHPGEDEQAEAKLEQQMLLNKYLKSLKESVSRKRKLKTTRETRDSLLAQVKFLRWRQGYLLKHQCSNTEVDQAAHLQNLETDRTLIEERINDAASKGAARKNSTLRHEEGAGREGEEEIV